MAKAKVSPRQQEILDLLKERPGMTAKEIAVEIESTENAVYQQISRLRSKKMLPKATRRAPQLHEPKETTAQTNGHVKLPSLEDHLASELTGVTGRIKEIIAERQEVERVRDERLDLLATEESTLSERQKRLAAANKALDPA